MNDFRTVAPLATVRRVTALSLAVLTMTTLAGCSLIPDLAPESLAANKAACQSVTSVWDQLVTVIDSPDLSSVATKIESLPGQLQQAIDSSTDSSLDDALSGLKAQVDALSAASLPDLEKLASAGASLAARCTVFGVTPDLTLPGM